MLDLRQHDLIALPVFSYQLMYCASPRYLAQYGEPDKVKNHHCYITSTVRLEDLPIDEPTQKVLFKPKSILKVNSSYSALQATLKDLGIAKLPTFMAQEYLKNKQLKQVFKQYISAEKKSYLFYKKQIYPNAKVVVFKKFILEKLSTLLSTI